MLLDVVLETDGGVVVFEAPFFELLQPMANTATTGINATRSSLRDRGIDRAIARIVTHCCC